MLKKSADYAVRMALIASMAIYGAAPALSQTVDHPSPTPNRNAPNTGPRNTGIDKGPNNDYRLARLMTRKVVLDLLAVRQECRSYDDVYRIDCLRQGVEMVAASLPESGEYREARRILRKAGGRLGSIVNSFQDRSVPKLTAEPGANPRYKLRRKYAAIKQADVSRAMDLATKVIDEAATELLRSGENSDRRYAHYQDISVAVDSTKVLLRSG